MHERILTIHLLLFIQQTFTVCLFLCQALVGIDDALGEILWCKREAWKRAGNRVSWSSLDHRKASSTWSILTVSLSMGLPVSRSEDKDLGTSDLLKSWFQKALWMSKEVRQGKEGRKIINARGSTVGNWSLVLLGTFWEMLWNVP